MRFAEDTTSRKLEDVLRVLGAAYGVDVAVQGELLAAQPAGRKRPRRRRTVGGDAAPPTDSQIRARTQDNDCKVKARGALPKPVVAAYREAHGG